MPADFRERERLCLAIIVLDTSERYLPVRVQRNATETPEEYAERVKQAILGMKLPPARPL